MLSTKFGFALLKLNLDITIRKKSQVGIVQFITKTSVLFRQPLIPKNFPIGNRFLGYMW